MATKVYGLQEHSTATVSLRSEAGHRGTPGGVPRGRLRPALGIPGGASAHRQAFCGRAGLPRAYCGLPKRASSKGVFSETFSICTFSEYFTPETCVSVRNGTLSPLTLR